jgi:hypothetical protein
MHKVQDNYSSFTGRNSENICSSSGGPWGAQAECKRDEAQFITVHGAFLSFTPLLEGYCSFLEVFKKIPPCFGPHLGFWYRVFLTLRKIIIICWKLLEHCVTYTWNCEKNSKIICVFGNRPWHNTRWFLGCVCVKPHHPYAYQVSINPQKNWENW